MITAVPHSAVCGIPSIFFGRIHTSYRDDMCPPHPLLSKHFICNIKSTILSPDWLVYPSDVHIAIDSPSEGSGPSLLLLHTQGVIVRMSEDNVNILHSKDSVYVSDCIGVCHDE
mmetsp:Transcript_17775/g.26259  ORF Transcript_17775/g.26259 Transcript_17775/m.26259 type:complete len:114 (+) Transcript_17775:557-898(+)